MASTRDIRRRIKSVKNTAQITKAMQMVAAAKMRRAQQNALVGRPYAQLLNEIMAETVVRTQGFDQPLIQSRPVKQRAVVLVSTDRGLCGGLNGNLFREAAKMDPATTVFITAGKKAAQYISRTKRNLAAEFTFKDTPDFAEARAISKYVQQMFINGEVDAVDILFPRFINTLTQQPQLLAFLPIGQIPVATAGVNAPAQELPAAGGTDVIDFEPDEETVLGELLPHSLNFQMHQILLETKASEQSARMVAMKSATDNAQQIIKDLTLEYNQLRQANITNELLEITTAQMAVS
jgi:F-type H+-transporting ATPase subunit gamma